MDGARHLFLVKNFLVIMQDISHTRIASSISTVISVYNTEEKLGNCLKSLLKAAGNCNEIEIIVVNDGSPGNCEEIVNEFRKIHTIRYIEHDTNMGLYNARLTGGAVAKGNYLTFVDADDTVPGDYFKLIVRALQKDPCDIISFDYYYKFSENNTIRYHLDEYSLQGQEIFLGLYNFPGYQPIGQHEVWNKVFRKTTWDHAGQFLPEMDATNDGGEDLVFTSYLCFFARSFRHIAHPLYFYNVENQDSNSRSLSYSKVKRYIIGLSNCLNSLENLCKSQGRESITKIELIEHKLWKDLEQLLFRINLIPDIHERKALIQLFHELFYDDVLIIYTKITSLTATKEKLLSKGSFNSVLKNELVFEIEKLFTSSCDSSEEITERISKIFKRLLRRKRYNHLISLFRKIGWMR